MTASSNVSDTIQRDAFIAAPIDKVWQLVSVPGWWVNDGALDLASIEWLADNRAVVRQPNSGDLFVELLNAEAPRTATFRWLVSGADVRRPEAAEDQFLYTRVTFTLTPEGSGTRLAVTESGFATAAMEEKARRRAYEGNSEGWKIELDAAKAYLETTRGTTA